MFLVDIAKFLRIAFLYSTAGGFFWQSYHSAVNQLGCLFFDFAPPRAFDLTKNFHETLHK